jgi:hypothetical protein
MIGNWKIYWFTGFMLFISIFFIIPNLSNDLSDYTKNGEIYKSSKIEVTETKKLLSTKKKYTLVLTMENGSEWVFDSQFSDYWEKLKDTNNIGKKYTFYSGTLVGSNPSQVEIENKIVYNLRTLDKYKYFMLLLTLVGTVISLIDYCKHIKRKSKVQNEFK